MAKPLPLEDFRALRSMLEPEDFAIGPEGPDPAPTNLVSQTTWNHIVGLPDDVSIRTSNYYGGTLEVLSELSGVFGCISLTLEELVGDVKRSPLFHVTLDSGDEFQASIYNALTGYYRTAFSCLRNVVEYMTIGLDLELSADQARFQDWLAGIVELKLGRAADLAQSHLPVATLEAHFTKLVGDDLFRQKDGVTGDPGGFIRRIFKELSGYTHGGRGLTDADLRGSNGPIFVAGAFLLWARTFVRVFAYAVLVIKLGQPGLGSLKNCGEITVGELFDDAVGMLPSGEDGIHLFQKLPDGFWL